ncbi:MAG TPA: rRNA maturation RNase YbeY [Candidatus Pacearchaeota archaeon]|nr:rRNA maturation RNase YbeY [Candidatus Pacearchaeota archaeon]HPR79886.1 rRNA maturation RNase YbeY [Candidatus Pacearchaeota archaeon]
MIEINNLSKNYKKIDKVFLKKVAEKVLRGEKNKKKIELSIAIVNPEEIKKLNKKYRNINKPTDVLSFGEIGEDISEVVICPEEVEKNGKDFKKELTLVLIHGILHLFKYDHEKTKKEAEKMFQKQEEYFSKIKF